MKTQDVDHSEVEGRARHGTQLNAIYSAHNAVLDASLPAYFHFNCYIKLMCVALFVT